MTINCPACNKKRDTSKSITFPILCEDIDTTIKGCFEPIPSKLRIMILEENEMENK